MNSWANFNGHSLFRMLLLVFIATVRVSAQESKLSDLTRVKSFITGVCGTRFPEEAPGLFVPNADLRWDPGTTLKVQFLDGSLANQELVLLTISEWAECANIFFKEVSTNGDIRIAFTKPGFWSAIGKNSNTCKGASMNLGFQLGNDSDPADRKKRRIILHEFGHALGFGHEHQSPEARINWDRDKIIKFFSEPPNNWTITQIESNILLPIKPKGAKIGLWSKFDPNSIMIYPVPQEFTTDGMFIDWPEKLSDLDKKKAAEYYPRG